MQLKNQTQLGLKVKSYLDKGELVPDELVIDVITEKAFSHDHAKGFVFDGFQELSTRQKSWIKYLMRKRFL